MSEITISGDELIFDGSQILQGYFSIGVGQGLEISDNIISIDNHLMILTNQQVDFVLLMTMQPYQIYLMEILFLLITQVDYQI